MSKFIQIKSIRSLYFLFYIVTFLLPLSACGGGENPAGESSSDTGSLSFNLDWQVAVDQRTALQSPSGDVCEDYAIETIEASIVNSSNAQVASAVWPCSEHKGTISGVPAGTGLTLTVDGVVAGNPDWQNQPTAISVVAGQDTKVGTIAMNYSGDDDKSPIVLSQSPASNATDVTLNSKIVLTFSEDVVRASVEPAFSLSGSTSVDGDVDYDPASHTATFTPAADLEENTQYTINISADVQDRAGHSMAEFFTSKFTTGMAADISSPSIPNLLSATAASDKQIDLSWEAANDNVGVTFYNIYKDDKKVLSVSTTSTTDTNLNPDTEYCYTITALDAAGNESGKSNEICAKTPPATTPIELPELMIPESGVELDNNCDDRSDSTEWDFDWSDVPGATQYQINITGPNTSIPAFDTKTNNSFYHYSSEDYIIDTNRLGWTWKVRAGNDAGQWSDWSQERYFNVELLNTDCPSGTDLLPPTLVSPQENERIDNNCQDYSDSTDWNFEWSSVSGATQYQIYVFHTGASHPVIDKIVNTPNYYYSNSKIYISEGNRYNWIWKVRSGNDANQWSDWSPEGKFEIEPLNTDCPSQTNLQPPNIVIVP